MQLNPYLQFNGQCEAAFKFYEQVLGGKIAFTMTYGESPMECQPPAELRGLVMHTRLVVGNNVLMGSDCPPDRFTPPAGFNVTIGVENPQEAERIFKALSENGKITMPIEETFWAQRFGMLIDQFGTPWMVNCEKKP